MSQLNPEAEAARLFKLKRPCKDCPFLATGEGVRLSKHRAEQIADGISFEGNTFPCHKTVNYDHYEEFRENDDEGLTGLEDSSLCAGSLIVLEKQRMSTDVAPNFTLLMAMVHGFYDPRELDLSAPTFNTLQEFVEANNQ